MMVLLRRLWRQPAGAVGASALAAVMFGSVAYLGQPVAPLHAQANLAIYHVGSLQGSVTATTTFSARHIYVYRAADEKLIAVLRADQYGHFGTTLIPGEYTVSAQLLDGQNQDTAIPAPIVEGTTTAIVLNTSEE